MSNIEYYKVAGDLSYGLDGEHTDMDLTRDEMVLLKPLIQMSKRALHLCCGAGRHVFAFNREGIVSIGVDISPFLIQQAVKAAEKEKSSSGNIFIHGDILDLPLASNSMDCITLLGNSFTLFPNDRVQDLLKEIDRVLAPEGLLILDIPNLASGGKELDQKLKVHQNIEVNNRGKGELQWERFFNPNSRVVTSIETFRYTCSKGNHETEEHKICFQLYSVAEICSLLEEKSMVLFKSMTHKDISGKYKGMLKNRMILVFKYESGFSV